MRRTDRPRSGRRLPVLTVSLTALSAFALGFGPAGVQDPAAHRAAVPVTWRADLTAGSGDEANIIHAGGSLRLRDGHLRPASVRAGQAQGTTVLPARVLGQAVNHIAVDLDATSPAGTRTAVDVRGRDGLGRWTEWREARVGKPAVLPRAVTEVQVRLTLVGTPAGATPEIRGLGLSAELRTPAADAGANDAAVSAAATQFSARVFATREGLVGGTTANGHVIVPNDHFVALPSRRGLSPKGSAQYSVRVCGPARCETAPVWDVGPWNTHDDYWNPSSVRETFKDLPQGKPEAQAAYENGYHGGLDEFGRRVLNPAGIDLADGTFYNVGLNNNGWVTVTYLWTGDAATRPFPTWGTGVNIRKQATSASTQVAQLSGPTTVHVQCQVHGQLVQVDGYSNDAWSYLPDYGGYISNIYIDVPEGWLPGVPTC
ncbi:hypothetical protein [Streptomyces sp. NPDC012825]|uniref:hypothetical protein n=1 Tax=Streptomyces sp. NPDC012825 TaxID=3364851 RepID=UPI00367C2A16